MGGMKLPKTADIPSVEDHWAWLQTQVGYDALATGAISARDEAMKREGAKAGMAAEDALATLTDVIRTAEREHLNRHSEQVPLPRVVEELGWRTVTTHQLQEAKREGARLAFKSCGLHNFAEETDRIDEILKAGES